MPAVRGPVRDYLISLDQLRKAQQDMISFHEAWITTSSNPAMKATVDKNKLSAERANLKKKLRICQAHVEASPFHEQAIDAGPSAAAGLRRIKKEAVTIDLSEDEDQDVKDPAWHEEDMRKIASYLLSPGCYKKPCIDWVKFAREHPHRVNSDWGRFYRSNKEEIDKLVEEYRNESPAMSQSSNRLSTPPSDLSE